MAVRHEEPIDGIYRVVFAEEPRTDSLFVVDDDDAVVLFDTGYEETVDGVFAALDDVGVEPERVVLTHEGHDHYGGLPAVVERYDVETWVPRDDAPVVTEETGVRPTHRYGHEDQVGRFEAVHVPGHTPGCSVLVDETAGVAVMGDTVIGSDVRGLPAGYLLPPPEVYTPDLNAAERNLERLLPYQFEVALVAHGESVYERASEKLAAFVNYPLSPM